MGAVVRRNERSWAIEIISYINEMLAGLNLKIKRAGGESTLSVNKKSMFPDVLLYADNDQTKILQGWELKMPDVLITDEEFIKDATRKAMALNLNSFFVWNFTYGKLFVKNDDNIYCEAKVWTGTSYITSRDDVKLYKSEWIPIISEVIIEINNYLVEGKIKEAPIVDALTDNLMSEIIDRNKSIVADNYQMEISKNMQMERRIKVWWDAFKEDYSKDEDNMYSAYSKTVLLNWTNRIMFANIIKEYHNCAYLIDQIDNTTVPSEGNQIIEEIVKQGDFYNVFNQIDFNDIIPDDTWIDIVDFNQFLSENRISHVDQTVLQNLLEKTVSASKREIRGQFSTPYFLADLLCQITVPNWNLNCADVCSGTGTIAKSIINNKMERLKDSSATFSTTWVSDKFAYPLQISNIALTRIDAINTPINVFQMNLFDLCVDKDIVIKNPKDGSNIHIKYPKLGAVVSNLPFVKANNIASDESQFIKKYALEIYSNTGLVFQSGKIDLYMFLPFKIHELLDDNGRLGIILSNSWLGTESGNKFYKALQFYYEIETIVLSDNGRWFMNADVVATLLVLQKREIGEPDLNHKINFCLTEKDLKLLPKEDLEKIISSIVLQEEFDKTLVKMKSYSLLEIEQIQEKGISLNALFHNVDWVNKIAEKLIPIESKFLVKRGERRGWNDLFYPNELNDIEEEYIKPVLKNAANLTDYMGKTDINAFCCHYSKEQLRKLGHLGALRWIEKFENIKNGTGKLLPIALKKSGSRWYEMADDTKADFVTALNPNRRLFVARFFEPTFVDQRFTRLLIKDKKVNSEMLHAVLNSIYGMFAIEAVGFGRGLGVLDASSSNLKKISMLDLDLISEVDQQEIITLFNKVVCREALDTEEELKDISRETFDKKVLSALNIEEYYEDIKKSLLSMQKTRMTVK